ncbi:3-oxo-Delta(4,5)-steroid 5-beta-reductase [Melia azedarach]|uniref:3-oxo-Delta(4,5)-steroid 5-beta-reductase n=1 Tax=Melia azedarach TaxID=155640 RepID=A0ACC1YK14_MELAZ|nr:3-oxo-Delta(4,5)-steroid 5-beta-reductase [Melia azedarach]
MKQENTNPSVALIVRVTGMSGLSLAEALKKPSIAGGPWKVYGASRRSPSSWFPSSLVHHFTSFDALDAINTVQKLSPLSGQITHVFFVAFQVVKSEEINISRISTMFRNVLDVLTTSTTAARPSPLRHISLQTGTKHYMGPIFDPSLAGKLVRHESPFREESPRLLYPNFYYAFEDVVASYSKYLTYSVHRSSIVVGASSRSVRNLLLTVAVYAGVCKQQGLPFRYPGINRKNTFRKCSKCSISGKSLQFNKILF